MNVVGVNGSGRVGGNTAVLVEAILKGTAQAGCQTKMLQLGEMTISGCKACRACKKARRCAIEDDMARFYELAPEADVLVLAAPIYLDHITAQLMAFVQRLFCYLGPPPALESRYPRPGARAVLGITYGAADPNMYDGVLDWLAARLKGYFNIETLAKFKVPSTSHRPILDAGHPDIQRAQAFGKALANT